MKSFHPESQRTEEGNKNSFFVPPEVENLKTVPLLSALKREVKTIFWDGVTVEDFALSSRQVFSGNRFPQERRLLFSLKAERIPSFWGKINDLKDYLEESPWSKFFSFFPGKTGHSLFSFTRRGSRFWFAY